MEGTPRIILLLEAVLIGVLFLYAQPAREQLLTRLLLVLVVGVVALFLIYLLLNSLLTVKKLVGIASDGTEMKERVISGFVYTPNAKRRIRREEVGFDRFFSGVQYKEREVWKGWSIAISKVVFVFVYICMVTCGTLALVTIAFLISFQI